MNPTIRGRQSVKLSRNGPSLFHAMGMRQRIYENSAAGNFPLFSIAVGKISKKYTGKEKTLYWNEYEYRNKNILCGKTDVGKGENQWYIPANYREGTNSRCARRGLKWGIMVFVVGYFNFVVYFTGVFRFVAFRPFFPVRFSPR